MKYKDINGIKFGHLIPIQIDYNKINEEKLKGVKYPPTYWLCKCDCGNSNLISVRIGSLQSGATTSCGCIARENITHINDLTGQKFGKLTVVEIDEERINYEISQGKRKKIYWLCECDCGNPNLKSVWSSHLKDGRTISCGCELTDKLSEDNNWTWGNLTDKDKLIRNSKEYDNWRMNVFKRDKYTCQCCGQIGKKLNAHHIDNFSNNPDKRLNINNGITLCEDCHSINKLGSFHNLYGTHNNTKEQLIEYIILKNKSLEIPYWTDNKEETWKKLINDKILEINNINLP